MKIAIIIPVVNLWRKYTKPCIDSIKTSHDYRILLVDNASIDETLSEAGKLVSDKFSHKRNEERWSCAKSWNFGIRDAWDRGFEYALVLNNDVILHSDCIDRIVERFNKGDVGMVTAMDIRGECNGIPEYIFDKKSKDYESVPETEHPNFSAFMISKKCWDKVGEFDEGFKPAYFEDNDYHYRMKLAGMKAIVYPPALFYHFGSRTQNESGNQAVVTGSMFEDNRKYYKGKWGGDTGSETFKYPFGYEVNNFKWTKQQNG